MHQPVLITEVLDLLAIKPNGRYVDGTLGLGGHAEAIVKKLSDKGRLLGMDVDPENLSLAKNRLQLLGDQTLTRRANFRGLQGVLQEIGWNEVDGVLVDLGVSSTQLDEGRRGMSFQSEAPLDMRLDPTSPETALSILESIDEKHLADVFYEFGERRQAKRISRYLLSDVQQGKIKTTTDLAGFCERVLGWHGKVHPATRVFLALRCLVNKELDVLKEFLVAAPETLSVGGRLAVISFHSLEDRAVKERFRALAQHLEGGKRFSILTKKPVGPTEEERHSNPRSRSAKLRVLERTE
jgi:16S rRNA (cytosine1402-N4)-methyltransferase